MRSEEMKSIKIAPQTHSRLLILSTALGKTITEVIDDLLEKAYPEIIEETDKVLNSMASIRRMTENNPQPKREKAK
jgi:hypothetical protein